jgi:hypothetical protein
MKYRILKYFYKNPDKSSDFESYEYESLEEALHEFNNCLMQEPYYKFQLYEFKSRRMGWVPKKYIRTLGNKEGL